MKTVSSIINPAKLDALKKALWTSGYRAMTVEEVRGFGFQKGRVDVSKPDDYIVEFAPKVRVSLAVRDEQVEALIDLVVETVRTGRIGDGKVFVSPLEQVVRVRTGERGEMAL
jgi:nitrogen regulatory protein P-II 1